MKPVFFRSLSALCAFAITFAAIFPISKAEAVVAWARSERSVAVVGGATSVTGVAVVGGAAGASAIGLGGGTLGSAAILTYGILSGGVLILVGLVILDEEGEKTLQFKELSVADAERLKLSAEREAFNSELPKINALADHLTAQLDPQASLEDNLQISAHFWQENRSALSPSTQKALAAVSAQLQGNQ